jgi:hypothetical protein
MDYELDREQSAFREEVRCTRARLMQLGLEDKAMLCPLIVTYRKE